MKSSWIYRFVNVVNLAMFLRFYFVNVNSKNLNSNGMIHKWVKSLKKKKKAFSKEGYNPQLLSKVYHQKKIILVCVITAMQWKRLHLKWTFGFVILNQGFCWETPPLAADLVRYFHAERQLD